MPGYVNRDAQNRVIFQLTDSIVRLVGSYTIDEGSKGGGAIDIPDSIPGTPIYFAVPGTNPEVTANTANTTSQELKLSGRRISWGQMPVGTIIRYGVF